MIIKKVTIEYSDGKKQVFDNEVDSNISVGIKMGVTKGTPMRSALNPDLMIPSKTNDYWREIDIKIQQALD